MRAASLMCCVLATGCFYVDPINQRPAIDIRQTSADEVYRRSSVKLEGISSDPEGQLVFFQWRVYACTDAEDFTTCDRVPFADSILDDITFLVPERRVDEDVPPQSLLVILEAKDDYGAIARPRQQLIIPIANRPPALDLSMSTRYGYVVNTPLDLYAKVSDADDGPLGFDTPERLEWTVFKPMSNPAHTLVDITVPGSNATSLQLGKRFTPEGIGKWEIQVTAIDPLGATTTKSLVIEVVPDRPPCLSQWAPIAAPTGSAWPMTDPTLFQVTVVTDDLDPYPTVPGDAQLDTTEFTWSLKQPGASTHTALGVTSNGVALDPGNYAPGDIVELRVEINDRNATPVNCADALATCSVISDDTCIQRLTWRVEVR